MYLLINMKEIGKEAIRTQYEKNSEGTGKRLTIRQAPVIQTVIEIANALSRIF